MPTKRTILLLAIRAAFFIVAAGSFAVHAREYLNNQWKISIPPLLYGVLGFIFLWLVFWLSTRRLFSDVIAYTKVSRQQATADRPRSNDTHLDTDHRYPRRLRYLLAAFGLFLVALPFISAEPGKDIAIVTYACCFTFAFIVFAIDLYVCIYAVFVRHDGLIIHAFGQRKIRFAEMAGTEIVKTKNGSQIVLSLKNGHVIRFGGMLTDFSKLSEALNAHISPTG